MNKRNTDRRKGQEMEFKFGAGRICPPVKFICVHRCPSVARFLSWKKPPYMWNLYKQSGNSPGRWLPMKNSSCALSRPPAFLWLILGNEWRQIDGSISALKMKIGIVTGGGDCPGLNAVIRAVSKTAAKRGWETIGIIGGYDGLLPPHNFRVLDYKALDGLLVRGGTILGTANRGQFSAKTGHGEVHQIPKECWTQPNTKWRRLGFSAHLRGRGRIADHRAATVRTRHSRRRGAEDHRQ